MKNLKQLVRNVVDPDRDLGHVDRHHNAKKTGSISNEKPYMSTGQSATDKLMESDQEYCRTMSSTNTLKASYNDHEQTVPVDADLAIARGTALNKDVNPEKEEKDSLGVVEACEDCR